jgi:hypothetical protein
MYRTELDLFSLRSCALGRTQSACLRKSYRQTGRAQTELQELSFAIRLGKSGSGMIYGLALDLLYVRLNQMNEILNEVHLKLVGTLPGQDIQIH